EVAPAATASRMRSTRSRSPAQPCARPIFPRLISIGPARDIQLLVDHRDDLVAERTRIQNRLRWHLHDLDPALDEQAQRLERSHRRLEAIARRLARLEQTAQVRVCRDLLRRLKALSHDIKALEAELRQLIGRHAEPLLE